MKRRIFSGKLRAVIVENAMFHNRFRFFILLIIFLVNVCQMLVQQNMIFAVKVMIKSRPKEDHSSVEEDCDVKDGHDVKFDPYAPFDWSQREEARLLSIVAIGMILGTICATQIFNYVYLRMVLSMSMIMSGLLSISTPTVAVYAGPIAVEMTRFFIGFYIGLLTPCVNLVCDPWYLTKERNVAITIAFTV